MLFGGDILTDAVFGLKESKLTVLYCPGPGTSFGASNELSLLLRGIVPLLAVGKSGKVAKSALFYSISN